MTPTPAALHLAAPPAAPRWQPRPETTLSVGLLVVLVVLWEFAPPLLGIPKYIIPAFSDVMASLARGLSVGPASLESYWRHGAITLWEALSGFALGSIVGLALAMLISQSRLLEAALQPYLVAFQCLPKVAVAPVLVLWFGYGVTSKVVIVALLTFFPVLVTSLAGFRSVEADRIDLMRSLSATQQQIFWKLRFPSALPFIFAGLDIAAVFAVVGAIVGEFIGAQAGLGVQILQMDSAMDISGSFSVFVVLAAMGWAISRSIRALQRKVVFWAPAQGDEPVLPS